MEARTPEVPTSTTRILPPPPAARPAGRQARLSRAYWLLAAMVAVGIAIEFCPIYFGTEVLTSTGLRTAEAATAITLAAASWKWIEEPILRNGLRATVHAGYRAVTESLAAKHRAPTRAFSAVALAAALMVACAAGYGVLRAPTSPGLKQQITQGAKISADSRTHKVTPAAAARVSAETPPPTPASTSCGGAHAYQAKIPGSKVTAIGDSVMLAAAPQLQAALKGIYIDAAVSRQMSAGLAVVQGLADTGLLRSVVVLGLGTNGTVTTGQIRQLLATMGPHHKLVLVNTFVPRPWQNGDNRVLAAAARKHANVVLANWFATIEHRTGLLWDDDVHPRPPGATLYARMVATAVWATRSPRPTASPRSATCYISRRRQQSAPAFPGRKATAGRDATNSPVPPSKDSIEAGARRKKAASQRERSKRTPGRLAGLRSAANTDEARRVAAGLLWLPGHTWGPKARLAARTRRSPTDRFGTTGQVLPYPQRLIERR